jgi:hypothetical protein
MEGVDFFILQCTKKMHIVEEDEREDFGGGSLRMVMRWLKDSISSTRGKKRTLMYY